MAMGRPLPPLTLDDEEREALVRWARRPKTAQALALRARIILSGADGLDNTAVSIQLGVSQQTVGKWRSRFLEQRLDGCWTSRAVAGPVRLPMTMWNG